LAANADVRRLVRHLSLLSRRPVGYAREAFLAAEPYEHVVNSRRGRSSGQRRTKRLCHLAELDAGVLGNLPDSPLDALRRPFVQPGNGPVDAREQVRGVR